jgi:hypothetical protein
MCGANMGPARMVLVAVPFSIGLVTSDPREIAAELFLSQKTVETPLRDIVRK